MCGGKCLDAAKPTPYFGTARRTVFPSCINLEEDPCVPEGAALFDSYHMCNDMCIPVYIPCNNTCLDSYLLGTDSSQELIGPYTCSEFNRNTPNIIEAPGVPIYGTDLIILYINSIRNVMEFDGICVPGWFACNGSCTINQKFPILKEIEDFIWNECVESQE